MVNLDGVRFPLLLRWQDGEEETFDSLEEFVYSVEDFHNDLMSGATLRDAEDREILVKLSMMRLDEFRLR